jgi:hypothetical protein
VLAIHDGVQGISIMRCTKYIIDNRQVPNCRDAYYIISYTIARLTYGTVGIGNLIVLLTIA